MVGVERVVEMVTRYDQMNDWRCWGGDKVSCNATVLAHHGLCPTHHAEIVGAPGAR